MENEIFNKKQNEKRKNSEISIDNKAMENKDEYPSEKSKQVNNATQNTFKIQIIDEKNNQVIVVQEVDRNITYGQLRNLIALTPDFSKEFKFIDADGTPIGRKQESETIIISFKSVKCISK